MRLIDTQVAAMRLENVRIRWPGSDEDLLAISRFEVAQGEKVFLRGPSGCGKSTLLSVMAGVKAVDHGSVSLLGVDWSDVPASRKDRRRADHIGFIFQQFNLLPYLSVVQNVLLPCQFSVRRTLCAGGRGAQHRAEEILQTLGLGEQFWNRAASDLSVGQQQRVAAARALIGSPEIVIADEPTSALDEHLRETFMRALIGACNLAGSALIFVSHDSRLAERFDRMVDLPRINEAALLAA
jgi:putative ABC transport system ATP-binding protein